MKTLTTACALVALCGSATNGGTAVFYTEQNQFHLNNQLHGKMLKGIEDFEESEAQFGNKTPFPNPLQHGVPRPTFPNGIDATNLIIQTNITPGACPPTPNPSNSQAALWVNGPGFLGSNSIKVGTDEFLQGLFSSIDLIFTTNDKTAVGLDVSTYQGFDMEHQGFVICAYDTSNNIIGKYLMTGATPNEPVKTFIGIWSPVPIGRVNVWGIFDVPQPFAVDNIEMWTIPAPGTTMILALGGLASVRRRRLHQPA